MRLRPDVDAENPGMVRRDNPRLLTLINQCLSSATSFGAAALAAGLLTTPDFGALAVCTAASTIVVGLSRTWSGMVLMMVAPDRPADEYKSQLRVALSLAGAMAIIGAIVTGVVGMALGGSVGRALLVLAPCLPLIALQDTYRYGSLARRDPGAANVNDGAWLMAAVIALMALRITNTASLTLAVLATFATAGFGLGCAMSLARVRPVLALVPAAFRSWSPMSLRLSLEFMLAMSASVVTLTLLTAWNANLEQAGELRAAQVMLGPLAVVFAATTSYFQPVLVGMHRRSMPVVRPALRQSAVNVSAAICWTLLLTVFPDRVGVRLFGSSWSGAQDILTVVGLSFVGLGLATGALTALRSRGQLNSGLAAQGLTAVIVVVCTAVGGLLINQGTLRGFAVGNLLAAATSWWIVLRWSVRDVVDEAAPPNPQIAT